MKGGRAAEPSPAGNWVCSANFSPLRATSSLASGSRRSRPAPGGRRTNPISFRVVILALAWVCDFWRFRKSGSFGHFCSRVLAFRRLLIRLSRGDLGLGSFGSAHGGGPGLRCVEEGSSRATSQLNPTTRARRREQKFLGSGSVSPSRDPGSNSLSRREKDDCRGPLLSLPFQAVGRLPKKTSRRARQIADN